MTTRIEDYGMIGDGRTAALVHRNGSIDWLCWPRFDSAACMASLLGTEDHGHWSIRPEGSVRDSARRYVEDTLILETDYRTAHGRVRVVDFMPADDGASSIVRIVTGVDGRVAMRLDLRLRFDFGRVVPWVEASEDGLTATVGPDCVVFRSSLPVQVEAATTSLAFEVDAGQTLSFVLSHGASSEPLPERRDVDRALEETTRYWRTFIGHFDKHTDWPGPVRRSILTLHASICWRTGGLVAAPTTSLPEVSGGDKNWDYRFCWLRDATFTMSAFLNAGCHEDAIAWRDWLLRAIGAEPAKLRIVYRLDGGTDLDERIVDWLPGFDGAKPVRIGNAAWSQHQLDVYGELLDALSVAKHGGIPQCAQGAFVERELVRVIETSWKDPGQGIWEDRGAPQHYVVSKVMAWVGVDRYLKGASDEELDARDRRRLEALQKRIHADVCRKGWHAKRGTFVQHYDSEDVDASLLLLPALGFLPADDPRIAATIDTIERELMKDGLLFRTPTPAGDRAEGAFLACTCWLADCRAMQGRRDEARVLLERVIGVANDLGLLAEEYDIGHRRLNGNFPQALSHLAVVNTALGLSGSALRRAGG